MDLLQQLRGEIQRYLDRSISLKDLDLWISRRVQEVTDSPDGMLRALYFSTWSLIDCWLAGDVSEAELREEMVEAINPRPRLLEVNTEDAPHGSVFTVDSRVQALVRIAIDDRRSEMGAELRGVRPTALQSSAGLLPRRETSSPIGRKTRLLGPVRIG